MPDDNPEGHSRKSKTVKVPIDCLRVPRQAFKTSMPGFTIDTWYSFFVIVFGRDLETQLSHYEIHRSKRFLLKGLLTDRR